MDNNSNSVCIELDDVLAYIEDTDDIEINQILDAVTRHYARYHPNYDISFLSLPREPGERRRQLERMLNMLRTGNQP